MNKNKSWEKKFSNSLIIIDEAHNINQKDVKQDIKDLDRIRKTKSWKVYPELSEFLKP